MGRPIQYMVDKYYREPRKRMRLEGYDYSLEGFYFITICTHKRIKIFEHQPVPEMVQRIWRMLSERYEGIYLDEFVVMPNHIHGLIQIVGAVPSCRPIMEFSVGAVPSCRPIMDRGTRSGVSDTGPSSPKCACPSEKITTLSGVLQWFKTITTNDYLINVKENGWPPLIGKLWQRGFYDRIVRSEEELNIFRKYIMENPENWDKDEENQEGPNRTKKKKEGRHDGTAPTRINKNL